MSIVIASFIVAVIVAFIALLTFFVSVHKNSALCIWWHKRPRYLRLRKAKHRSCPIEADWKHRILCLCKCAFCATMLNREVIKRMGQESARWYGVDDPPSGVIYG